MVSSKDNDETQDEGGLEEEDVARETPVATYTLIGILLVGGLLYAALSYTSSPTTPSAEPYNGYTFTRTEGGFYETTVQGGAGPTALQFRQHPSDVENISMDRTVPVVLRAMQERNGSIYLTVAPEYATGGRVGIALFEISKITNYMFGIETKGGVTEAGVSSDYPVVTCDNVTPTQSVIRIDKGRPTSIAQEDGCITVKAASSADVIRAADRIVYDLLGIIEG